VSAYGEDLAHIHDAGFSDLAATAAKRVVELLADSGIASGLVVDLGCGSGVTARRLTASGYDVLGIDSSEAMIELARLNAPAARFRVGSIVTEPLPDCRAVTAIGEVLNYLPETVDRAHGVPGLLGRIHRALRPGGLLVLDVAGPGRVPGGGPVRVWTASADWAVLVETREDDAPRVLSRHITTFRRSGTLYRRGEEQHRQRLYRSSEVLGLLRAEGFRARALRGYGRTPFAPGHSVFVARKPGPRPTGRGS
jgi:SAM-dependent methyltransferase